MPCPKLSNTFNSETERNRETTISLSYLKLTRIDFSYNQKNINIQFLCKIHWEDITLNLELTALSNAWNPYHFINEEINVFPHLHS